MKLPKLAWGARYLGATDCNVQVTFVQPNSGHAIDGTPLAATNVATVWSNVAQWRGKEKDNKQTLVSQSSYKVIIPTPTNWTLDSGMLLTFNGHTLNIDSFSDPDGQNVETHIWAYEDNPTQ